MRFRAALFIVTTSLLALSACALTDWFQQRGECGLKCPKNSSCQVVASGVFTASYGCVCNKGFHGPDGALTTWDGQPCVAVSPSPIPEVK